MRKYLLIILLSLIALLLNLSVFTVEEGQRGIVLRFGKVLRNNNHYPLLFFPGLHLKTPFIDSVQYFDSRLQTMVNQADRFVTKEKKDLIVDSYIKWRISDFSSFYATTGGGDIFQAENLLKRKFSDRLRSEIGRLNVKDIVTDSRGKLTSTVLQALNDGTNHNHNFYDEKNHLVLSTSKHSLFAPAENIQQNSVAMLGIQVIDVRIKQISLPSEVSEAIYNRMRAERESDARHHRSQGKEQSEKIRALSDYNVTRILAEAERKARIIRGEADAIVTKLYATYFSQDLDFYMFLRSLRAYEKGFSSKKDIFLWGKQEPFLAYMMNSSDNLKNK
ncbi:MAG: protease modulator HflC [Candidatus Dasytiphilus stammeri]